MGKPESAYKKKDVQKSPVGKIVVSTCSISLVLSYYFDLLALSFGDSARSERCGQGGCMLSSFICVVRCLLSGDLLAYELRDCAIVPVALGKEVSLTQA